jgi:polysaccharide biosynthesis protein PslH
MKIFVLLSRVPYPLDKGDKLRAYHQINHLSQNHEVFVCCLTDSPVHQDAVSELSKICQSLVIIPLKKWQIYASLFLGMFSDKPFQVHYFFQKQAKRKIDEHLNQFQPDRIFSQLIRVSEYVKDRHEYIKVLDYMDALSKGVGRRVEKVNLFLRPFFRAEHRRLVAYENIIFEYFERKVIISKQDRNLIFHPEREQIAIIPNGVDTDFFKPNSPAEKSYDLAFHGNMGYPPNIDAALFLANEILPIVLKKLPKTKLLISGASPAEEIKSLESENIHVSGWVDDVRETYRSAKIFVAPMRIGTGLQNKLLEAMAMRLPCVTTTLANNALGALPEKEIMVAENANALAESMIDLLTHEDKADALAEQGQAFILRNYDWKSKGEELEELICKDRI